jgi:hypothetical protein
MDSRFVCEIFRAIGWGGRRFSGIREMTVSAKRAMNRPNGPKCEGRAQIENSDFESTFTDNARIQRWMAQSG